MSLHGYSDGEYDDGSDVDNVTLISKLDVSHPLHLHPNDSVALTVVSVKLKGTENYQVWSCAMLLALEGKSKTRFIDGSCRRSNTDEVLGRQWDRVNDVVLGWILNSISEELFLDASVTFSLHHKIHTLSQNGSSIADYYHKLNALWKQFDALIKLPRCTCHAADDFKKHNQLMKLMQFLMGLDDTYMQIRSSILSRETIPGVRNAYVIIFSEESHMIATGSVSGTSQRSQTSDEQMATLISLIKENSVNGKRVHFNMAGANQHITYTGKNLINVIDISYLKIKVTHPDRTETFITRIGNMPLTDYLTLYDVLVVPVLGHPADQVLDVLKHTLSFDNKNTELICDTCQRAKQTREHFPLSDHVSTQLGELVHLDLWGPYKVTSREEFKFLLIIVDDFSRVVWVYLLQLPTSVLNGKSPYDLVYNKPPSLKHLRCFGCLAYATILNRHDKFGSRSEKCVLVGYSNSKKGYKLWSLDNKQVIYSRQGSKSDEERRNLSPIRHGNSHSHSGSTSVFSNENDAGPSQDADASTSENESFAVDEDNKSSSEGNGLHDQSQDNVSQDNNGAQNLRRKAIGSKWVWKIKYKSDGEIERYKARLVAKGFNQREGIDFDETFSLVVKIVTVRCLINLAVQSGWSLFQMDINNAFLYGDLEETVYMTLPPGYFLDNETKCSKSDYSLFTKSFGDVFIALLVYVDDIIITWNSLTEIEKYCLELIDEFGLLAGKPSNLPMQPNISLISEPSDTDPLLNNFMHNPLKSHLKTSLKVIRYLKGSPGKGINVIKRSASSIDLKAYSDADWARCADTKRSITGYCVFMCGSLVS
ncbi:ribonuclease H-like domain-containing protein [Tanacetum coccineum]